MDGATEVTAELYVRSLSPAGTRAKQAQSIDRLRVLCNRNQLHQFRVQVWGKQVGLSTTAARTETGKRVLNRIADFKDWATDTGRSIDSFFETRERSSSITGEEYTALDLPVMVLAEYRDGDVSHVAPHYDGDTETVCTVADRLAELEHTASPDSSDWTSRRDKSTDLAESPLAE